MAEVLFYHLEHKSWEQVLPKHLSVALQRNWRCVVQTISSEHVQNISDALWESDADLFLTHGTELDGKAQRQPIWVTDTTDNPNQATVRFFMDGVTPAWQEGLDRLVILFDGQSEDAVSKARDHWKQLKANGHAISYWQQDENLRWVNRSA